MQRGRQFNFPSAVALNLRETRRLMALLRGPNSRGRFPCTAHVPAEVTRQIVSSERPPASARRRLQLDTPAGHRRS